MPNIIRQNIKWLFNGIEMAAWGKIHMEGAKFGYCITKNEHYNKLTEHRGQMHLTFKLRSPLY